MPAQELSGTAALVTGASRGFGRGIAAALSGAGAEVVGVARDRGPLEEVRTQLGSTFTPVVADAAPERAGLGVGFTSVLPQLTPATELGAAAVAAYAAREGVKVADFLEVRGPALTPEQVGQAIVGLARDPSHDRGAYLLTAAGLAPVS